MNYHSNAMVADITVEVSFRYGGGLRIIATLNKSHLIEVNYNLEYI